jgi:myo-inositol 2-dehydrogenase/D-chiro-inositol 1-dehydrogenase
MTGLAVFGAGRIGKIHARNLHSHPDAVVRYVVDVDEKAANELALTCGARVASAGDALSDPDVAAVVIASSTDTHTKLIKLAASAGKAIFCEKPLDLDTDTAREGLSAVEENGVYLSIGFNRRHDPTFSRLKEEIDAGTVGTVEHVTITSRDPSPPPADYVRRSGGIFRDMMIHDFDMARWLLGEEPLQVYANGSILIDDRIGEAGDVDSAVAVLSTASGKLCSISNSRRCSYGYDQRIEVFGSAGMLNAGNKTATEVETADSSGYHKEVALPFFLERYADSYRIQLDKFLRAIRGESVDLPGGADGLKALVLADCAQQSLQAGSPIAVPD